MSNILFENKGISCEKIDDFAVFRLKSDVIPLMLDIPLREEYHAFITKVYDDDSIKGIVHLNHESEFNDVEFSKIYKSLFESGPTEAKMTLEKTTNTIAQISRLYLAAGKPSTCGMIGEVGFDYLGLSMLFDHRCLSEDATIINTAFKFGFPPIALLPYFLKLSIGLTMATEVLLCRETLSAKQALDLKIVNCVQKSEDVLENCLNTLETMCMMPQKTFRAMQQIAHPRIEDLEAHLDLAKQEVLTTVIHG